MVFKLYKIFQILTILGGTWMISFLCPWGMSMKELRTPFKLMVELMFKAKLKCNFSSCLNLNSEHCLEIKLKSIYSCLVFGWLVIWALVCLFVCLFFLPQIYLLCNIRFKKYDWSTNQVSRSYILVRWQEKRLNISWQHVSAALSAVLLWEGLTHQCSADDQSHSKASGNVTFRCMEKCCWKIWYTGVCQWCSCGFSPEMQSLWKPWNGEW